MGGAAGKRLDQSAHSCDIEGHAIDLQDDKWLLPWANLTTEDRAAARLLGFSSDLWDWQMVSGKRLRSSLLFHVMTMIVN